MPGGLHPPPSVILSWVPDYVDPPTRGWAIVILVVILLFFTYLVVGLRLWARFGIAKNSGIDDVLIIFNMLPLTGLAVSLCLAFRFYGFDKHVWDNSIETLMRSRKITMALEALYMVSTSTTKISILLFYRRLTSDTISLGFLRCVHAAIAFVVLYFVVFIIVLFMNCQPFHAYWRQVDLEWNILNESKYHCIDEEKDLVAAAVVSVIQDFIACGMPSILFWKLKMPRRQKFALAAIFGVGFFLCICGVLRIAFTIRIYTTTYDMTWESYMAWIWFALEAHLAVICASAPALKIFFKQTLKVGSFASSFSFRKTHSTEPISNSAGSTTMGRFSKTRTQKMGLNDITIDTEDETFELSAIETREKPFTIFSSEERLSDAYDNTFEHTDMNRMTDEEAGRKRNHGTFFVETDSE